LNQRNKIKKKNKNKNLQEIKEKSRDLKLDKKNEKDMSHDSCAAVALPRRRRDYVFRFVRERLCYAELRAIERQNVNFFYYFMF